MGCDALYDARLAISGKDVALFDLATWKNGLAFKKIDFSDSGIPVIKIAELNNGIGSSTSFTRGVYSSDVKLQRGDFLFSWSGNPETSIDIFRFELEEGWLNQHIFKTTPNSLLVTGDYFFYLMKWLKPVFKSIASNKQTTGLGHITISDLKKIKVTVPAKDFQGKVAAILTAIDNKISLNAKLNGYLEELCDALFLDFLERADSSWHEGTLEELAEVKYGKNHKKLADGPYPVYGSGGFMRSAEKSLFSGESVLIPRKGSLNNVMYVNEAFWTVDTMFFTVPRIPGAAKFLYQYVKRLDLASMNSGSAVPSMTTSILNALSLPVPPRDSLLSFNAKLQSMYDAVRANNLENRRLESLRDSLLPKLMSGEIDASKVDLTQLNSHLAEPDQNLFSFQIHDYGIQTGFEHNSTRKKARIENGILKEDVECCSPLSAARNTVDRANNGWTHWRADRLRKS